MLQTLLETLILVVLTHPLVWLCTYYNVLLFFFRPNEKLSNDGFFITDLTTY
jgi:hypothetical protein